MGGAWLFFATMKQHPALETPMADLVTFRALPTPSLPALDPFLFLNHHGPQVYPPQNQGLPFGPHPHKGFETLTFVFDGEVAHSDSTGQTFVTGPGGAHSLALLSSRFWQSSSEWSVSTGIFDSPVAAARRP